MGYNTHFKGVLEFAEDLKASQLAKLKKILGEDCRDHPEWKTQDLYSIDLKLTEDFSGLVWDGSEKTYSMAGLINVVVTQMRPTCPTFGLKGELLAQGEDIDDRYWIAIGPDGYARREDIAPKGKKVTCPFCCQSFRLEEP
jgi:hypothetical protein